MAIVKNSTAQKIALIGKYIIQNKQLQMYHFF